MAHGPGNCDLIQPVFDASRPAEAAFETRRDFMLFDCARILTARSLAPSRERRGATTEPTHDEARAEADARLATHVSRASSIEVVILGAIESPPIDEAT